MARTVLLAPLALAVAACATKTAPEPEREGGRVRVAAWNIAWFGDGVRDRTLTGNRDGRHLREDEDLRRLREVVERLADRGVEVVALQEIENKAAALRLFPEAEWAILVSHRRTDPEWAQRTAITVSRAAGWRIERHPDLGDWSPLGRDRHGVEVPLSRRGRAAVALDPLLLRLRSGPARLGAGGIAAGCGCSSQRRGDGFTSGSGRASR